ncbi:MAG: ABC transporter permease, partial [Acidimicrobiales bacterium]
MTPIAHAARLGLTRGLMETRQSLTDRVDLTYNIAINGILLFVVILQRGSTIEGTSTSLAAATLPSLLGMTVVMGGFIGAASVLAAHREDGTLLRAKA